MDTKIIGITFDLSAKFDKKTKNIGMCRGLRIMIVPFPTKKNHN